MTKRRAATVSPDSATEELHWSCDVALLTNRFILWDFLRVFLIAGAVMQGMVLLMSFLLGDELMFLPLPLWGILAAILAALFVLSAGVVLQNSLAFEYALDDQGAYGVSRIRRRGSRVMLAVLAVFGVFAGNLPMADGAWEMRSAREGAGLKWREVGKVTYHPAQRVITLNDSWHSVLRLYVPAEQWASVVAYVQAATAKPLARPRRAMERRPWRAVALWAGIALVGTLLSGAWPRLYYDHDERFALLAGVLLLIASWPGPTARWFLSLGGGASALYFAARLVLLAAERMSFRGRFLGYGFESDPALLALSVLGVLALLGLSLYGLLAPRLARRKQRA
jgi:hypothetical protein